MNDLRLTLEVARWEFFRFFKVKDFIMTLISCVLVSLAYVGIKKVVEWNSDSVTTVVFIGDTSFAEQVKAAGIELLPAGERSEDELRAAIADGEIDGLLMLSGKAAGELVVRREPLWKSRLEGALTNVFRLQRLTQAGLSAKQLGELMTPVALKVQYLNTKIAPSSLPQKLLAGGIASMMFVGLFVGNALLFVAITGEKQNRVTEQVIAAISPQMWIDGKILGLSAMAVVSTATLGIGGLTSMLLLSALGEGFSVPIAMIPLPLLAQLVLLALLGFFMWFTFFAGVAATIDDPNTSSRGALLFAPLLPGIFAIAAFQNPDTWFVRLVAVLPPTAPAILPIRLILGQVVWWEFPLAVVLLMITIWLLRKAAGRIFLLGILMYGKEPSLREMIRVLRR